MANYYGDLHIHIGYNEEGQPVKITGSKDLNFNNIAKESLFRKGLSIIGIVDCGSPRVLKDIKKGIKNGNFIEIDKGGLKYQDNLLVILGTEIEIPCGNGSFHIIAYIPTVENMEKLSNFLSKYMKNINLSTQKAYISIKKLYDEVKSLGGILVPAHIFTPFKGIYGNCTDNLKEFLGQEIFTNIPAVELGLSGDSLLASLIKELDNKAFLSNSDAHSLGKIAREYNLFNLEDLSFDGIIKSFKNLGNNKIAANYGLDPKLGKYHRSYCVECNKNLDGTPPQKKCDVSVEHEVIMGVLDRIYEIKDRVEPNTDFHPPYYHQIPLEFLPGVGKKTIDKLIKNFSTEMNILNNVQHEQLSEVVGTKISDNIILSRKGKLNIRPGGGGKYGKINIKSQ